MFYREAGIFKTSYAADMALFPLPQTRWAVAAIAVLFIVIAPLTLRPLLPVDPQPRAGRGASARSASTSWSAIPG